MSNHCPKRNAKSLLYLERVILVDALVLALLEEGPDLGADDLLVEALVVDDGRVAVGVLSELLGADAEKGK